MKTPVEIINEALRLQPDLWLHEVSEADEWHVCHWGERIEGEKREWIVVAEACNEYEAKQKRDRILDDRNGATAIAALEAAGFVIVHPDHVTEEIREAFRDAEIMPLRGAGGQSFENYDRGAFANGWKAALRAAPKWTKGSEA